MIPSPSRRRTRVLAAFDAALMMVVFVRPLVTPAPAAAVPPPPPTAQWVIDENALPGTDAWRIRPRANKGIVGYADHVSAQPGDTVKLYVDTKAPTFRVKAFRLGFYQGLGAQLIWTRPRRSASISPRRS